MLPGTAPPDESHESGKEKHNHYLVTSTTSAKKVNMIFTSKNKMFIVLKPGI